MIQYLIYHVRFMIHTPLGKHEVSQRLLAVIEQPRWWRGWRPARQRGLFSGEMQGDTFRLRRNISYRNGFRPVVKGCVEATEEGGSRLVGTMTLSTGSSVYLLGCPLAVVAGLVFPWRWRYHGTTGFLDFSDLSIALLLLLYILTICGFSFEVRKARALLTRLVDATPEDPPPRA
jgi:hypothetical protein